MEQVRKPKSGWETTAVTKVRNEGSLDRSEPGEVTLNGQTLPSQVGNMVPVLQVREHTHRKGRQLPTAIWLVSSQTESCELPSCRGLTLLCRRFFCYHLMNCSLLPAPCSLLKEFYSSESRVKD